MLFIIHLLKLSVGTHTDVEMLTLNYRSFYDLRPAQQDSHSYWIQPDPLLHDQPTTHAGSFLRVPTLLVHVYADNVNVFPLHSCIIPYLSTSEAPLFRLKFP